MIELANSCYNLIILSKNSNTAAVRVSLATLARDRHEGKAPIKVRGADKRVKEDYVERQGALVPICVVCVMAILVACSGGGQNVIPPQSRHVQEIGDQCGESCDWNGTGTPAPAPTPNVPGQVFCNAQGGDFLDITGYGRTGLTCSGGNGRAPVVVGTKCGIQFHMSGGGLSQVVLPNGNEYDNVSGLEINGDDCSYQITY